ncbi:MAG: hypothetical protein KJS97_03595, partial [Alphaproteobacteria bacterium]|nr:hypothetical protein [Alphaproteobacteria bacterium]
MALDSLIPASRLARPAAAAAAPVSAAPASSAPAAPAGAGQAPLAALGAPALDGWLGGGIARAAIHEVFPATGADQPAAAGFGLALLARAAAGRPVVWVRHEALTAETGRPYGPGLADWGLDPARVLFVRAAGIEDVLRAAGEAARCGALGGVIAEAWGEDKRFDLTASRRLALRVEQSGAPLILMRAGAAPAPSAAATRWRVRAAPSRALAANAPGLPALD